MLCVHVTTIFFTLKFMRLLDAAQCQICDAKHFNMISFVAINNLKRYEEMCLGLTLLVVTLNNGNELNVALGSRHLHYNAQHEFIYLLLYLHND